MSDFESHRIYNYLNEPVRVAGLTLDELAIGVMALLSAICSDHLGVTILCLVGCVIVILTMKHCKKMIVGFSLLSFCHWHFGVRGSLDRLWPQSHHKRWLS